MDEADIFSDGKDKIRNRLAERARRIIDANADAFAGRHVLDIASNNGRWSHAAIKAGARKVTSIEGRQSRVDQARAAFDALGVSDRIETHVGDMVLWLHDNRARRFDTVLCLGIYYHVMDHYGLLQQIARLEPQTIVIDSGFVRSFRNGVRVASENPQRHSSAIGTHAGQEAELVGTVTLGLMMQMAWNLGYSCRPVLWDPQDVADRNAVKDYLGGVRFTLRLERTGARSDPEWKDHWRGPLTALKPEYAQLLDVATHDAAAENQKGRPLLQDDFTVF